MLDPNKSRQLSAYKRFVSMNDSDEIEQFFEKKHIPSILGDGLFVDKIKEKYFKGKQPDSMCLKGN